LEEKMGKANYKLKARIIELWGSQADFAEYLEVDESYISKIVRRRRELPRAEKVRWAKALEAEVNELWAV